MLLDSDIIYVVEEEQIRGAIQKTYALNPQIMQNADAADTNALIQNALHSIGAAFQVYFAKENSTYCSRSNSTFKCSMQYATNKIES
mgnify:CR=1 FL=1